MRIVAGLLCASVSACSFGMKSVDPKWDGSDEPECTDTPLPVVGDAIVAGLALGVGVAAGDSASESGSSGAGGVAIAGVLVASDSPLARSSARRPTNPARRPRRSGASAAPSGEQVRRKAAGTQLLRPVNTKRGIAPSLRNASGSKRTQSPPRSLCRADSSAPALQQTPVQDFAFARKPSARERAICRSEPCRTSPRVRWSRLRGVSGIDARQTKRPAARCSSALRAPRSTVSKRVELREFKKAR
jgi:hypothetical protein